MGHLEAGLTFTRIVAGQLRIRKVEKKMCTSAKIDKRKVQAYNLLKRINKSMFQAKEWQAELMRLEDEINELEKKDGES